MEERKANWTEESVNILVDSITDAERWAIIRGKFGPSLTIQSKQKMWMEIAERVNSSSSCLRTVKDVKKKWQDIQSQTKKKEANRKSEMRKTGGGPHPSELKPWEEKIVAVLSSEVISGVEGGYDSLDTDDHISGTSVGLGEKRKLDEMILIEGFEVPISESKRPSSCATSNEPERFVQQFVPSCTRTTTCGEGSSKRQRYIKKDVVGNSSEYAVKDRIIQLEEEKLKIMKEQLSIEKKKLCILEDYVAWRKQQGHSPSVSPVIKGLIEF
ncbi:uncharacterized protein LOC111122966 [Crassostrea virginica]|uniref:Uncharacterized protein LOC111122966 n=1 Tax=Crassostrea virginica TaxID=6565 RepID=A0A8B8CXX3_CRAVI|nr:uncharacterized protein LOC111122966 [Crassostrea virginica]